MFRCAVVLLNVGQFLRIDVAALGGGGVEEHPEPHPDEPQYTYDDEGQLPPAGLGQQWYGEWCHQCAYRSPGIEDGGGKGAVFLREVLGSDLDSGREIACLAQGQHAPGRKEAVHADGGYDHYHVARGTGQLGSAVQPYAVLGDDTAQGMQASSGRPYPDGPQVAALGAQPVDESSGKEHAGGIHEGEHGGDGAVM